MQSSGAGGWPDDGRPHARPVRPAGAGPRAQTRSQPYSRRVKPATQGLANLLISHARGRWAESRLRKLFPELKWSGSGPDALDPKTGIRYEVHSGTLSNMDRHSEREGMFDLMWRIISF